jgi:hypothetical protein
MVPGMRDSLFTVCRSREFCTVCAHPVISAGRDLSAGRHRDGDDAMPVVGAIPLPTSIAAADPWQQPMSQRVEQADPLVVRL